MKKRHAQIFVFIILLLAGGWYVLGINIPDRADAQVRNLIKHAGFLSSNLKDPEIRFGLMRYRDVALDQDGFSAVKSLELHYNPIRLLLYGELKNIVLDGLLLTGEMTEDGALAIAGWQKEQFSLAQSFGSFSGNIVIQNSSIAILTNTFGGISTSFDLVGRRKKNGAQTESMDIQLAVKSAQKNLGFLIGASGSLNAKGFWKMNLEVEQGRLSAPPVKTSRFNGRLNIAGRENQDFSIFCEFQAGSLVLYGYPWQNVAGTLEGDIDKTKIFFDAQSVGFEGLDLSLSIDKEQETNIAGIVHTEDPEQFINYMDAYDSLNISSALEEKINKTDSIDIDFFVDETANSAGKFLTYNVRSGNRDIAHNEKIDLGARKEF